MSLKHDDTKDDADDVQANRDAGIREAECEKAAMDVKYSTGQSVCTIIFSSHPAAICCRYKD